MDTAGASTEGTPGATGTSTLRGDSATSDDGASYRLIDGPRHVAHEDRSELPGHHEATFATAADERFDRYLTDKGRAELLRLIDAGQHTFTLEEVDWLTTEPTMPALLTSMAGEGAEGG